MNWLKRIIQRIIGGNQPPLLQPATEEKPPSPPITEKEIVRVADVRISLFEWDWWIDEERECVTFAVKPTNSFCPPPFSLFFVLPVRDYRPGVIEAAKALKVINPDYVEDRHLARVALDSAVRQPAKVVVTDKTDGSLVSSELILYPSEEEPTALLSLRKKKDGRTLEDDGLWNFCLASKNSKTDEVIETVLAILTDKDHKVVINDDSLVAALN